MNLFKKLSVAVITFLFVMMFNITAVHAVDGASKTFKKGSEFSDIQLAKKKKRRKKRSKKRVKSKKSSGGMEPYIGLAFHTLKVKVEFPDFGIEAEETASGIGLNGGLFLNGNSKVNFTYYSLGYGDDDDKNKSIMVTYDYLFGDNHQGFMLGGGINSATVGGDTTYSKVIPVVKLGYEHRLNKNFHFEGGYIHHLGKIEETVLGRTYEVSFSTHLYVGANYIF
jgi:hypothetical protein